MNAQQIDDILSHAKIDKNGRIMNKGRLNDMLLSLHFREVEKLNKPAVIKSVCNQCDYEVIYPGRFRCKKCGYEYSR